MTTSKDRIKFYLPARYFTTNFTANGMNEKKCRSILRKAFRLSCDASARLMDSNPGGFWIVCTPSQFAHFIVYRNEDGECVNGIRDLEPTLFRQVSFYERLARQFCIGEDTVKGLARALGYENGDDSHVARCRSDSIDVSKNEFTGGTEQ